MYLTMEQYFVSDALVKYLIRKGEFPCMLIRFWREFYLRFWQKLYLQFYGLFGKAVSDYQQKNKIGGLFNEQNCISRTSYRGTYIFA